MNITVSSKELETMSDLLQLSKKLFLEEDTCEPPHMKIALDHR